MKKIWQKLNGKKTVIGISLHAVWFVANMVFKDFATMDEVLTGHALIGTITGVGIGHKINKSIERANQK
jgi:hypothetical protein